LAKTITIERAGEIIDIKLPLDIIDQLMKEKMRYLVSLRMPFAISEVPNDSPNHGVLKKKDLILSIDGVPVKYHDEVVSILQTKKGAQVQAVILRNQKEIPLTLQVNAEGRIGVITGALGNESIGKLGIYKLNKEEYGLFESIPVGIEKGKDQFAGYVKQLQIIFNPDTGAYKGIGGFKAIFDIFPTQWSWEYFWSITAMLSIMLGVMNLLPIPALDGGHVMFVLFEMISGKKPSDKFMEYAQLVGFVLLISLLVFANGNDIYRAFGK
jgi:regulator of sigma E protease